MQFEEFGVMSRSKCRMSANSTFLVIDMKCLYKHIPMVLEKLWFLCKSQFKLIALCKKKYELNFELPRGASVGKMYFLVLVTKFAYQFTQGSPTLSRFLFRSYDYFFVLAISPKRKECPLILTLCRLMIEFCYLS